MNDQFEDGIAALIAFHSFWLIFYLSWQLSLRYGHRAFAQYTPTEKAEWCTRICSTVHASVVIPGVVLCLVRDTWNSDTIPFDSPNLCRKIFSVSIGYFGQDLIALVKWKLNYWQAFVAHHIVGALPYVINNFVPNCHCANYVLALFLLVEIPTLPLNCVGVLDQIGMRKSNARYVSFIVMYALWFLARIILPIYLLVVLYEIVIPAWYSVKSRDDFAVCVVPSTVSANVISFFCFYIFLTQLSVDLYFESSREQQKNVDLEDGVESPESNQNVSSYGALVGGPLTPNSYEEESSSDDEIYGIAQMYRKANEESARAMRVLSSEDKQPSKKEKVDS
mmetsp:Transcript_12394/g.18586  ORF Transcript_12394/g.18586 Transcript_12394/m.18586 type:complete len:336 (+) Transcript_12394:173-1180(+)